MSVRLRGHERRFSRLCAVEAFLERLLENAGMKPRRIALVGLAAVCVVVAKPGTDASTQTRNTGGLIAFVRPLAQYPTQDLFLVNQGGQRVRRLTRLAKDINDPAWSPDGRQLAFEISDDRRDGGGLWVMKADGSDARRVAYGRISDVVTERKADRLLAVHTAS